MTDNMQNAILSLNKISISYRENESLAMHTTFKIGGKATVFCEPTDAAQLCDTIRICKACNINYFILGKGSNVLFADEGFGGAVILAPRAHAGIELKDNIITAAAGADLAGVCIAARDAGLTGLEFAYGIPGSVGGAVYMNAGAYGGEIKDVLHSVQYFDGDGIAVLSASEALMGYRTSIFNVKPWCILAASFALEYGDKAEISAKMRANAECRREKQPLDMPSAGSAFKRPVGAYAGALIDECGLRGYTVGGAAISDKHCGFIVNKGGATCAEVIRLSDEVCAKVKAKTGFCLEKEIKVISYNGKTELK